MDLNQGASAAGYLVVDVIRRGHAIQRLLDETVVSVDVKHVIQFLSADLNLHVGVTAVYQTSV